MFDFLFKRIAKKSPSILTTAALPDPSPQEQTQSAAHAALLRAGTFGNDEAAAAEFVLQCKFADARLKAAECVQSKAMLEQVLRHVRNTDRRVSKLVQARLDTMLRREAASLAAQECVESAQRLLKDVHLLPNQLVDIERRWQTIEMQPEQLQQQFDVLRTSLRLRLEAQATLQRTVIDSLTNFKNVLSRMTPESCTQLGDFAATMDAALTQIQLSPEAPSLPKSLLAEFAHLQAEFEHQRATMTLRQAFLEKWEASEGTSRKLDVLKNEWNALPALNASDAQSVLQERYESLLQSIEKRGTAAPTMIPDTQEIQRIVDQALGAMETALEKGLLQVAIESDQALRAIDVNAWRPNEAQAVRLAKARTELSYLQGWARWGGNVSREELLKTAEELPDQSLSAIALAKKVGSLRERWKSLGASAGQANKVLWERFDAACNRAYEPAAAQFKLLAEERQHNLAKAHTLIKAVQDFSATSDWATEDSSSLDWKQVAQFFLDIKQSWQRLGIIERKEKKQLDASFWNALAPLMRALENQRALEVQRREALIQEVSGLNSKARSFVDAVRDAQGRWRASAKSMPLDRHVEQVLWQRFKHACDHLFMQRKDDVAAADADRRRHLQSKEAICSKLELVTGSSQTELSNTLKEAMNAWEQVGQVPRGAEAQIEARYQSAVSALHQQLENAKKIAQGDNRKTLEDKLRLCNAVENAIMQHRLFDADACRQWREEWQDLDIAAGGFERTLLQRFESALAAYESGAEEYAIKLNSHRIVLSHELLLCEIMCGVDSPSELANARLQLQVEVLQTALKNGKNTLTLDTQLLRICSLPVGADHQTVARIERLIHHII